LLSVIPKYYKDLLKEYKVNTIKFDDNKCKYMFPNEYKLEYDEEIPLRVTQIPTDFGMIDKDIEGKLIPLNTNAEVVLENIYDTSTKYNKKKINCYYNSCGCNKKSYKQIDCFIYCISKPEIIEMYINQNFKKYQKSSQFGKFLIWIFYIHHYKHFLKNSFVAHKTRHPQSLGVVAFHTDARGPGHEPQRHCHSPTHCFQQPHRASERMGFNRLLLSHRSSRTPRHPQNQKRQGPPLPHQRRSHDPKQRDGIDKAPAGSFFPRCSVILHDVTKRHFKGFCASNPKDNHGNNKQHRDDLSSKTGGVAFSRKDQ
jgi:hypothetical protein